MQYEGEAWVKVSGMNNCGSGYFSDSLLVIVSNPIGIENPNLDVKTSIHPNPTNGIFILSLSSSIEGEASVVVTNQLGSTVYSNNIILRKGDLKVAVNLENQPSGLYFVTTSTKKGANIKKLLIVK